MIGVNVFFLFFLVFTTFIFYANYYVLLIEIILFLFFRLSDKLLERLLFEVISEIDLNEIVEKVYNSEFE